MTDDDDAPDIIPLWGPDVVDVVVEDAAGDRQLARLLLTTRGLGWGLKAAEGSVEEARPGFSSLMEEPLNYWTLI